MSAGCATRWRPHDSPERLRRAGVDVFSAHGRFAGPARIAADGRDLRYRTAVIATGSRSTVPGHSPALTRAKR